MARRNHDFQSIRSEGGLLPSDLLRRVLDPREKLPGTLPENYGLPKGERLNEVITQSWNRLRKHWAEFLTAAANLPEGEAGTGLTNEKWNLPLLRELGFGMLPTSAGPVIGGRTYAINRFVGPVPVHLVGCGLSLDRRAAGVRGAAASNPHGLVQEFLNRSPGHLWAIVSNGLRLRVLRDNQSLSRQSFLEFDLETMFSGEVYSDFVLLWLMAHATRFSPQEGERAESCWLEKWTKLAEEQGTRALGDLRIGVENALQILGEGFTSHSRNAALRDALRTGQQQLSDFHGQLLRIVYRLIFLFVAEDRSLDGLPLLHPRDTSETARIARERYSTHYSTVRLRDLASKIKGSRHGDLWRQFQVMLGALSGDPAFSVSREQLALPALGSFLWNPDSTAALNAAELTNHDFLEALRHLAFTRQGKVLRPVDYKNLGAEELGGVYESLLALSPQISSDGARFTFAEFAGSERKTSGSYYTPDLLVQCLLDSALDPVVEEAIKGKSGIEAEMALLALKVCDPAVGSGHFLVGAAHRLARHLSRVRALAAGESESSPLLYQQALRDVIGRCLYGVDVNPMAAELCRVSLWLEALEPGKPLSFLDHHIRVGNSLLGTTPELIAGGLPDEAFNPIEGDDKKFCSSLKKQNKKERAGQRSLPLFMVAESQVEYNSIESRSRGVDEAPDDTIEKIRRKADQFNRLVVSPEYQHAQRVADAWCAAFVCKKQTKAPFEAITADTIRGLEKDPDALPDRQKNEVERLAAEYSFFHWHLAFPEVFAKGGFDCVLGNPPWERVKLQEKEWFAERSPEIANAPNAAARKRLIESLKSSDPRLYEQFLEDSRKAEGESHLLRHSGRYPLCGRGDINVYTVFAEGMRSLLNDRGRVGCILPTGIATDDTTKFFFQEVVDKKSIVSLYDFENRHNLFPDVDSRMKFCLLTSGRGWRPTAATAEFVFFAHAVEDLRDPDRRFTLSAEDIVLLNPNTRTCPIFRARRDAELTKAIYRRVPVLIREAQGDNPEENLWGITFSRMFDMSNDSHLFRTWEQLEADGWQLEGNIFRKDGEEYLPLYEGKLGHQFNHRYASQGQRELSELTYEQLADAGCYIQPQYWVSHSETAEHLSRREAGCRVGLLGFRRISCNTNERTAIAAIIPWGAASYGWIISFGPDPRDLLLLCGVYNSIAFDYLLRNSLSQPSIPQGTFAQVPALPSATFRLCCLWERFISNISDWLLPRALELIYTAWDLEPFAQDCGWKGPPFKWDEERRFLLRCELDAAFFHLYLPTIIDGQWKKSRVSEGAVRDETPGELAELKRYFPTPRDAVAYIMDTFPIVKRRDEEKYGGDYRTKRVILEIYDEMARVMAENASEVAAGRQPTAQYNTRLNPPPGPPIDSQGNFISMYQLDLAKWPAHIHPPHPAWEELVLWSWFNVCQKKWKYLEDDQVFPWDGREAFIFALVPYLVQEKPTEKFEFYRDAALLASRSDQCERLLLGAELRNEYHQAMKSIDWLQFPDRYRIRPRAIRETLQNKQIIQTDAKSGASTIHIHVKLPPLPRKLKPLLPLILKAADNLDRMQRLALKRAEAEKVTFTVDEINIELKKLMVA